MARLTGIEALAIEELLLSITAKNAHSQPPPVAATA
jgi:hypothetical protein